MTVDPNRRQTLYYKREYAFSRNRQPKVILPKYTVSLTTNSKTK